MDKQLLSDVLLVCRYPPEHTDIRAAKNRQRSQVNWADRVPTAIFRGNSTGPGVSAKDNQRIKLAAMSLAWKSDPRYNELNPVRRFHLTQ